MDVIKSVNYYLTTHKKFKKKLVNLHFQSQIGAMLAMQHRFKLVLSRGAPGEHHSESVLMVEFISNSDFFEYLKYC